MIALLAAAISFATIDAPHHGRAFVIDSNLENSRMLTSGDAIGCSTLSGCPDAVYVRFPDQPGLRYPAIVWKPPGSPKIADSVQMLTVGRGELTPLNVADRVALGDAISLGACAPSPAGSYVASVSPALDVLRTSLPATPAASGCPLVTSAGVAGVLVPDVSGLSANPGPLEVAAMLEQATRYVQPSWLTYDPLTASQTALLSGTYPANSSDMYVLPFDISARALCARADRGDASAAYGCAQAFLHNYGAPRDLARAITYLRSAANHNVRNAEALLVQTQAYFDRSATQFSKALATAQAGDAAAMRTVGEDYRDGIGVTQSTVAAYAWFEKALTAGDVIARSDALRALTEGSGVISDPVRIAQLRAPAAMAPTPVPVAVALAPARTPAPAPDLAHLTPAELLARAKTIAGSGDVVMTAKAYMDAAKTGDARNEYEAAMYLGHTYGVLTALKAAGMIDADERSDQYMDDAAKKRYWRAEWMMLGGNSSVSRPVVIAPNPSPAPTGPIYQAIADTLPAANAHDGYAEQLLAEVYLTGQRGVPRDCAKGIMWGMRALTDGGISTESVLGASLAGSPYDRADAHSDACLEAPGGLEMLKTAAGKGGMVAQWRLATLYETGRLVPQNMPEAIRWYRLAASGDLVSQQWLEAHGLPR